MAQGKTKKSSGINLRVNQNRKGKYSSLALILSLFLACVFCELSGQGNGDTKKSIEEQAAKVDLVSLNEKGCQMVQLAIAYLRDQNQEKAFQIFLEALDFPVPASAPRVTENERQLYDQGLQIYLDHSGPGAIEENAIKNRTTLEPILAEHPDYFVLNFLLASAYANLEMYQEFMESFYKSFQLYPEHYLAYKTKAILHVKLFERYRTVSEREGQRKKISACLTKAIEKNPMDTGLYKLMMVFASEENKGQIVSLYLNKMINDPIIVPRADIAFFVHKAAEVKELDLGQKFVDKAGQWYKYSRVVLAAQEFLDIQKKETQNGKKADF